MVDIHSHIIFDVDDGPKSYEESIKMLKAASTEGITEIISTSHAYHPQYDAKVGIIKERIATLQQALFEQEIPLTLHIGQEVRIHEHICQHLGEGAALTLANSNYLLLELPSSGVPQYTFDMVNKLVEKDITPIIAHPERNKGIAEKPELLSRLIRQGALSQVTAGSIAGHFGKSVQRTALNLIDAQLVHSYGSDVHNLDTRPYLFLKGLNYLEKHKRSEWVDYLLENNDKILFNHEVILLEPGIIEKRKWWSIF
ncbi:tyrosine-protein phosphatase [Rummeliibacillus sp. JY-2-4R]